MALCCVFFKIDITELSNQLEMRCLEQMSEFVLETRVNIIDKCYYLSFVFADNMLFLWYLYNLADLLLVLVNRLKLDQKFFYWGSEKQEGCLIQMNWVLHYILKTHIN